MPTDKRTWPYTLADHDGLWCVFCLHPILSWSAAQLLKLPFDPVEYHHPLSQSEFRTGIKHLFPRNFPVGWTVPAHSECHAVHFADAFAVAQYLISALAIADPAFRDDWARQRHEEGLYWHALAMNADTLHKFHRVLSPRQRATLMERQLSAASGIRSPIHPFPEALIHESVARPDRTRVLNHLVNRQANRGHARAAHDTFQRALTFLPRAKGDAAERVHLSTCLRRAQVDRTVRSARTALAMASSAIAAGGYTQLTASLLTGWNALSHEQPSALAYFGEVLDYLEDASWLYVAEAIFGKACHAIRFGGASQRRIYQWLVQAQYIYALLGLQGTPHTNLPASIGVPPDVSCFPGHLLVSGRFANLSSSIRRQLRWEAIGSQLELDWLYGVILDQMAGRRSSRSRIRELQQL